MAYDELEEVGDDDDRRIMDLDEAGASASSRRLSFLGFWNMLVLKPSVFFTHYFEKGKSPYLFFVLMIVGICGAIDRLEHRFLQADVKGQLDQIQALNNWPAFWGIAVFGGVLSGLIYYGAGGWWYNVRVGWAGGHRDAESARFLYLYSAFIPSLLSFMSSIGDTVSRKRPYPDDSEGIGALIVGLTLIAATFYSVYVSYRGVRTVMDTPRWGARVWFLFLPALTYAIIFVTALGLFAMLAAEQNGGLE